MRDRATIAKSDQDGASSTKLRRHSPEPAMATVADNAPQALADFSTPVARRGVNLISLQRAMGNQAVQRLLARPAVLDRTPLREDEELQVEGPAEAEAEALSPADPATAHDHISRSPDEADAAAEAEAGELEGDEALFEGEAAADGEHLDVRRKPDPHGHAGPIAGGVIQRAGRAQAIRDGLREAKASVGGGLAKAGRGLKKGTIAAGKGIGKAATYATTVGIKDGTGVQNKAGRVAGNIAEGMFNALVGPLSPRWWYKAVSDVKGIKKSDYGRGAMARVFQVLAVTSQVVQKIGTTAGVLSLALGIAGVVLGSLMGAGAACALGSAVCGLIAFIASCTAFILQSVLTFGNLVKQGWTAISGDADKKKRFINDLASMIGSAVGVVGGGLGVNWGGGAGLFDSNSKSVLEGATSGLASSGNLSGNTVTGATSTGSQVGQQFANFGMGQMFGSASDTVSETAGVLAKHDTAGSFPIVQRDGESEGGEAEGQSPEELKAGATALMAALSESKADDDKTAEDMKVSVDAIDNVGDTISKPMSALGVPPPAGSAPPDMPLAAGVSVMPAKMDEAKASLDSIEADASKTGTYKKKDAAKLEKADTDVEQAEAKMGITGEPAKKPSLFKRAKDWLVSKVLNLKARIKKLAQAAKTKLVSVAMDVLGIKDQFDELKDTGAEDRKSNVDTIEEAAESSEAAEEAEEKAEEFSSSLR